MVFVEPKMPAIVRMYPVDASRNQTTLKPLSMRKMSPRESSAILRAAIEVGPMRP